MKKLRLVVLIMLLTGGLSSFKANEPACFDPGDEGPCPKNQPRPNGCKCCSDNHCVSDHCEIGSERCVP